MLTITEGYSSSKMGEGGPENNLKSGRRFSHCSRATLWKQSTNQCEHFISCLVRVPSELGESGEMGKWHPGQEKTGNNVKITQNREKIGNIFGSVKHGSGPDGKATRNTVSYGWCVVEADWLILGYSICDDQWNCILQIREALLSKMASILFFSA